MDKTCCLGFPLRNQSGQVVGSISLSDTRETLEKKREELIRDGLQAGKCISRELGWNFTL
jgi:DNA-binding IclR family transcriptional regulator